MRTTGPVSAVAAGSQSPNLSPSPLSRQARAPRERANPNRGGFRIRQGGGVAGQTFTFCLEQADPVREEV